MKDQQNFNKAMLDVIRAMSNSINLLGESSATHLTILRSLGTMAGVEITEEQVADTERLEKQRAAAASAIDELERLFNLPDAAAGPASSN